MPLTAGNTLPLAPTDIDYHLSVEDAALFRKQGYLGPFSLCTPEQMAAVRHEIETEVLSSTNKGLFTAGQHNRHLDNRLMYDLTTHPAIVQRMASIYGEDLMLWRTHFFTKDPGGPEIPWHQDYNYWPLEPAVIVSAWLAVDPVTVENSAVQIIPGSHRKIRRHVKALPGMGFAEMCDPETYDATEAVDMELKPGEFFLFNERTLHHSEPNRSDRRRMGIAIRVIVPIVHVIGYDAPEHGLIQISGRDPMGINHFVQPPPLVQG